jgi:3-oxoadipate enol-lactonase
MAEWTTDYVPGKPRIAFDHMGEGPLVLFMHGIGGNRTNWHDQLPVFAKKHFHAVAWDARGYGKSDDYDGPLDFGDFGADVLRLLDHFKVEKAHLCGLSMGGRIAQDFYPRHPERVATMVLCDTFPGYDASFTAAQRAEFVRIRKEPLVQGKEPKDIAPVVAKTLIGPKAGPDKLKRLIDSMSALHKESYIKTVEATTHYNRVADLPNIKAPTLLVFGGHDKLTTPELGRRMQAQIKGSEFVEIKDAGHLCNIEKPDVFNAAVLEFLTRHRDLAR